MSLRVKRLSETAVIPSKAKEGDVAYDLYLSERLIVNPNEVVLGSTGIAVEMEYGVGARIRGRSSTMKKYQCLIQGEIDNGYRGEIKIMVGNFGNERRIFEAGERIAQFIPFRIVDFPLIEEVDALNSSDRGDGGFGSTGK